MDFPEVQPIDNNNISTTTSSEVAADQNEDETFIQEVVEKVIKKIRAKANFEAESPAHIRLRAELALSREHIPGFTQLGKTGVIYVMSRAREYGYYYGNEKWSNFGQGAPETGVIPNQPPRHLNVEINDVNNEYGPVAGLTSLRKQVAKLYNELYRKGKESQYTERNVCICPGGRAALSRLSCCIGAVNIGFFLPDYTAYEQLLSVFPKFVPIPHSLHTTDYKISYEELKEEIKNRGLSVILMSNPVNPTGNLAKLQTLESYVSCARKYHTSLILDEFYSHFIYPESDDKLGQTISAAEYIEDVNKDPIIIVNGITKNWRLPGWRISWVVGPEELIDSIQSTGSFMDGGACHPLQDALARSSLLDPNFVYADAVALQHHFRNKRNVMLTRLKKMGIKVDHEPEATFYIWANLSDLPAPLDNGIQFFEEALTVNVICVPGIFFDINPGKRRELFYSPFHHYVRFSFGPPIEELLRGLDSLELLIEQHKASSDDSNN